MGILHPRERLQVAGPGGSLAGEGTQGSWDPVPSARQQEKAFPCLSGDGRAALEQLARSVPEHRLTSQKQPLSPTLNLGIFCLESCVPSPAAFCSLSEATGFESLLCPVNQLPNSSWTLLTAKGVFVNLGVHGLQGQERKTILISQC